MSPNRPRNGFRHTPENEQLSNGTHNGSVELGVTNNQVSEHLERGIADAASGAPRNRQLPTRHLTNRHLTEWDVAALIINKMIGTGIFVGPATVLLYMGNRTNAIILWVAGFGWTVLCMYLYLEYARKYPYTGGELIYLDSAMPGPSLLWYSLYAIYFVTVYTTTTNALQFARQVIIAAQQDGTELGGSTIPDQRVWRLIAVAILATICLLVYFSPRQSRRLNLAFALLKVIMLFIILVGTAILAGKHSAFGDPRPGDSTTWLYGSSGSSSASAILSALFSYQGWENATLVSGEITNYATLKRGFLAGVIVVGTLYTAIAIAFSYGVPWDSEGNLDVDFVSTLFSPTNKSRAECAWAIIIALSAAGSMLSVTYTCCRVKQGIAWANILPWSPFWRYSDTQERHRVTAQPGSIDNEDVAHHLPELESPRGGIVLHFLVSTAYIGISAVIDDPLEAASFSGRLLSYGQVCVGVLLAAGYWGERNTTVDSQEVYLLNWLPRSGTNGSPLIRNRYDKWIMAAFTLGSGLALCATAALPDRSGRQAQGWWFPAILGGIAVFALLYWSAFFWSSRYTLMRLGHAKTKVLKHGEENASDPRKCTLCRTSALGSRQHHHARYGFQETIEVTHVGGKGKKWFLGDLFYWFFGGRELVGSPRNWFFSYMQGLRERRPRPPRQARPPQGRASPDLTAS